MPNAASLTHAPATRPFSVARRLGVCLLALTALGACASAPSGLPGPLAPASKAPSANGLSAPPPAPPPPPMADGQPGTMAGAPAPPSTTSEMAPPKAAADDRPGLATHWGESRESAIRTTSFSRADNDHPSALGALWYNDREGSRAMANSEGYRTFERASMPMADNGVTMALHDGQGHSLPGFFAGGKTFAIGESGSRYVITLHNTTPARFEVVVSVDGLDVLDGKAASYAKRGYILNPQSSLDIEGFRTSESAVATFRFGSVRGSYAEKKGDDRNVGVIGVALFHERGTPMWPWPADEIQKRKNADPFPGRFATPPP